MGGRLLDIDGFHATTNVAFRESADAPPALTLVAKLSPAIALFSESAYRVTGGGDEEGPATLELT